MADLAVHRATLALLVAVLDDECDDRAHALLCDGDDPHLPIHVAHQLAHDLVAMIDQEDHGEMRTDIAAELLQLAGE